MEPPRDRDRHMTLGPNTNALIEVLLPKCILCGGEDRDALWQALTDAGVRGIRRHSSYRCYEFWLGHDLLIIWTGIGTGCLEPLLWEILRPRVIEQLILVGTAGRMPDATTEVGQVYIVDQAWLAGTGLDRENITIPLRPRWPNLGGSPLASCVSTDFFYGFAPPNPERPYFLNTARLLADFDEHVRRKTGLVDMETAQFYALCRAFAQDDCQFIAVKGASNTVGQLGEQVPSTPGVLTKSLELALRLFAAAQ
jgi:hypothetical protein